MRRPGQWLRTAASRVCARQTLERIVDPIVADIQTEYDEAVRTGRCCRAVWIRITGYASFWKAVSLCAAQSAPSTVWNDMSADGWALGRTIASSLVAFISLTALFAALPMVDLYSRVQNITVALLLLPQAFALSIPIALPLGIVCAVSGRSVAGRRIRGVLLVAVVATLLAFAAILIVPDANQAFRVAMAEELAVRGITRYSLPRGLTELPLSELSRKSREYDERGLSERAREFSRAYHVRFALPAATFVLSLLALGIGGCMGKRVLRVMAIVIALAAYWAILGVTERTKILPVFVSVWTPNIVFTAISLLLLRIVRQQSPATE